jgi:hypothetical protein
LYNTNKTDDWTWYVGQYTQSYNNHKDYAAACVEYTVPEILDAKVLRTISIPGIFGGQKGISTVNVVLSTTPPSGTEWRHGPTSGVVSEVTSFYYKDAPITLTVKDGADLSGKTVYVYLYLPDTGYGSSGPNSAIITQGFDDATLNYMESGLVYIEDGSKFEQFLVYIDNGSGWDLYSPYRDNGSSWDLLV